MNFKKALQRKREAAKAAPQRKPVSEMTEAELDRELQSAQAELAEAKRGEIVATRDAVAAETGRSAGGLQAFLASRRRARRAPWK